MFDGKPVSISLPQRVTLEIVETEPVVKGQTASGSYKPAKMSNGVRVMVPPHIGTGTRIVVSTEDGTYVERAKTQVARVIATMADPPVSAGLSFRTEEFGTRSRPVPRR